jgi:hypothetical protein
METVENDVILFTEKEMEGYFRSFNKTNVKIIVKELNELYYYRFYDIFKKQWEIDEYKFMRSPELFIVWYNKLQFIKEASNLSVYDNYIWCDIGCFRENQYRELRRDFCKNLDKLNRFNILSFREPLEKDLKQYEDQIYGSITNNKEMFLGGTILGCPYSLIGSMIELQDRVFDKLINSNRFYGCDQRCYAYMFAQNQELFNLVKVPIDYKGDPWFYLLNYYSEK